MKNIFKIQNRGSVFSQLVSQIAFLFGSNGSEGGYFYLLAERGDSVIHRRISN